MPLKSHPSVHGLTAEACQQALTKPAMLQGRLLAAVAGLEVHARTSFGDVQTHFSGTHQGAPDEAEQAAQQGDALQALLEGWGGDELQLTSADRTLLVLSVGCKHTGAPPARKNAPGSS